MEIIFRTINLNDTEAIAKLSGQLGYEISASQTRNNINAICDNQDNESFVATHENKIVGWIHVAYIISMESVPFCEIRGMVVDEQFRKNNIGRMLIGKAKQWCAEKNCHCLRLRSNVKREDAHLFYLHVGFVEKKEQTVFEITL